MIVAMATLFPRINRLQFKYTSAKYFLCFFSENLSRRCRSLSAVGGRQQQLPLRKGRKEIKTEHSKIFLGFFRLSFFLKLVLLFFMRKRRSEPVYYGFFLAFFCILLSKIDNKSRQKGITNTEEPFFIILQNVYSNRL